MFILNKVVASQVTGPAQSGAGLEARLRSVSREARHRAPFRYGPSGMADTSISFGSVHEKLKKKRECARKLVEARMKLSHLHVICFSFARKLSIYPSSGAEPEILVIGFTS